MFERFKRSKSCFLFCFFWLVFSVSLLQAQGQNSIPDIEKTYLHTDNFRYFIGENLFYKAYNVHANNNVLDDNSNILYVELVSLDSKIIARNKTNIEIGLGHGDFQLLDSLGVKPGVYQLRAYTNWNRNFGEDFVFKKNIEIFDAFESRSEPNDSQKQTNEAVITAIVKSNNIRVDFFPEGGSLLENVSSVVGFKAVESNGTPIDIKGEVYDSDNTLVVSFSSSHEGMGKFKMMPIEGKKYHAKITDKNGKELQIELPEAVKQGYLLSFAAFKDKNSITISTNQATLSQNPNEVLTVVCRAKGITYLEKKLTLTETSLSFELEKDKAPEGISQITLYDSNLKPQSERLVYIEKEHDFDVQLSVDKTNYAPNEKVMVNVISKSKEGTPKAASFSLSVTDMNGVIDDKDYSTNISSYFLMESDIRGKVYNPSYYFDPANVKRLEHLDNLLLTQGWRDFLWKTLPKASDKFFYNAEKGITISGRVKQAFGQKPKINSKISLTLSNKKHMNIFGAVTDSVGRFKFENIMFSGKTNMYLNARNEKGKFKGEIVLDSIEPSPMFVSFKNESIFRTEETNLVINNVFKKYVAYGVKPENMLNEVKIAAQKKKYANVPYGVPDYRYMIDKNEAKKMHNVAELIEEECRGVIPPNFSMEVASYFDDSGETKMPLILIDGNEAHEAGELLGISPEDVLKIEVASGVIVKQLYDRKAVISVFTNGNRNRAVIDKLSTIRGEIEGFQIPRVFYSPDPEKPNEELDKTAAVRNTIYWDPYVHPDKTGKAALSFYNSMVETKVKVALEGITGSGIPVVKKMYYTVKKLGN